MPAIDWARTTTPRRASSARRSSPRPAHQPARAVAGGPEGLLHRALRADENERVAAHVARDDDRLAERPELRRERRVPGAEGARRPLAMDADPAPPAVDLVLLELRDVVADVVHE